jgi:hypothetical protein
VPKGSNQIIIDRKNLTGHNVCRFDSLVAQVVRVQGDSLVLLVEHHRPDSVGLERVVVDKIRCCYSGNDNNRILRRHAAPLIWLFWQDRPDSHVRRTFCIKSPMRIKNHADLAVTCLLLKPEPVRYRMHNASVCTYMAEPKAKLFCPRLSISV